MSRTAIPLLDDADGDGEELERHLGTEEREGDLCFEVVLELPWCVEEGFNPKSTSSCPFWHLRFFLLASIALHSLRETCIHLGHMES